MAYSWYKSLSLDESIPEAKRKDRKDEAMNILKAGLEANPSRSICPHLFFLHTAHSIF